eukprot:scaffold472998_cov17-Prasinocladus_malaysianus.AAC.1
MGTYNNIAGIDDVESNVKDYNMPHFVHSKRSYNIDTIVHNCRSKIWMHEVIGRAAALSTSIVVTLPFDDGNYLEQTNYRCFK